MSKQILLEFLDFLKYKVENDLLTMEDVEAIKRAFESSVTIRGTIDDFANFYGQSQKNVTMVIHRRMVEKPIRRVYYPFCAFRKIVPNSWHIRSIKKDQS